MREIQTTSMRDRKLRFPHRLADGNHLLKSAGICIAILLLSACASKTEATARTPAVCEALRPDMPIKFHSQSDQPDTVKRIKAANARYQSACG